MRRAPDRDAFRRRTIGFAWRWLALTHLALLLVIGLTRADDWLGAGPVLIGAVATVATWAALSVTMAMAWLAPDRVPAWVELARRDDPPRDR